MKLYYLKIATDNESTSKKMHTYIIKDVAKKKDKPYKVVEEECSPVCLLRKSGRCKGDTGWAFACFVCTIRFQG